MKKLVAIFLLAVLVPSMILGWLAVRSLRDQELVVQSQRALLHQGATDALAADVVVFMDDIRVYFRQEVEELLAQRGPDALARDFDNVIRSRWAQVEVGAVVSLAGELISPRADSRDPRIQQFRAFNESFLTNRDVVEVYKAAPPQAATIAVDLEEMDEGAREERAQVAGAADQARASSYSSIGKEKVSVLSEKLFSRTSEKKQAAVQQQSAEPSAGLKARSIQPYSQVDDVQIAQEVLDINASPWSNLMTRTGAFRELIGEEREGAFSRFHQNALHILVWFRPQTVPDRVFCAQLDLEMLKEELGKIVSGYNPTRKTKEVCLALLEEKGNPIAMNVSGFTTDWKQPFVASEIGEILPHWEVSAYLLQPGRLGDAARVVRFTLGLLIFVLIAAIGFGSLLIFLDLGRQMKLARQKTDFVSNVSHELKTPLTSIRMFSDLLSESPDAPAQKTKEYAGVISSEAARLTRLINNLLDFSRMERGDNKYKFEEIDLVPLVHETAEHYRPHLQSQGIALSVGNGDISRLPVRADRDAVSQVLLNLISNAEKYGGDARQIDIEIVPVDGHAEVRVMDRGPGITGKDRARIFEKFYRADDSLSTGIQGSGLGLTLARQIARAHGGDLVYRERKGGGSSFVIRLPLLNDSEAGVPPVT